MKRGGKSQKVFSKAPIPTRSDMKDEANEDWTYLNELIWKYVGCEAEKPIVVDTGLEDVNNNRNDNNNTNNSALAVNVGASTSNTICNVSADYSYIWRDNPVPPFSPLTAIVAEQASAVNRRVYVSNIPFRYNATDLHNLCDGIGVVKDAEVIYNERGSKGFGFVSFTTEEAAQEAIKKLNGAVVDGRKIEVHPATPKERKKKPEEVAANLNMLLLKDFKMLYPFNRSLPNSKS